MSFQCNFQSCSKISNFRCSKCKIIYYCSKTHQQLDWITHKKICSVNNNLSENQETIQIEEIRRCRCMFCGKELLLKSEAEAIQHMNECCYLQEQLMNDGPIVIPKELYTKIQKK